MNSLKSKVNVKLILLLSLVVFAATFFVAFSANAEESTNGPTNENFNLLVDIGNKSKSIEEGYLRDTETSWHPEGVEVMRGSDFIYSEYDLIQDLKEDKNIETVNWNVTSWDSNKSLNIQLNSEDNMLRKISFILPSDDYLYLNGTLIGIGDLGYLSPDIDNKFILGENDDSIFVISGTVYDSSASDIPMQGVKVRYYSTATPPAFEELTTETDSLGKYSITVPVGNYPGELEFSYNKYYEKRKWPIEEAKSKTINAFLYRNNLLIEGVGDEHIKYHIAEGYYQGGECLEYSEYENDYWAISIESSYNMPFTINDKGVFTASFLWLEEEDITFKFSLDPICVDGYEVDRWNIDGKDYYANSSGEFTITPETLVNIYTYYKPAGSDDPEIVPTNEEVTAQTGDSTNAVVSLFMLAVMASVTCLYLRKKSYK